MQLRPLAWLGIQTTCFRTRLCSSCYVTGRLGQASMDSPLVTHFFCQLFSYRAPQCLARGTRPALVAARHLHVQKRDITTKAARNPRLGQGEIKWHPRTNAFPHERTEEFDRYPLVTANMLKSRKERPQRVKMLLRDFIEGWMPNWQILSFRQGLTAA